MTQEERRKRLLERLKKSVDRYSYSDDRLRPGSESIQRNTERYTRNIKSRNPYTKKEEYVDPKLQEREDYHRRKHAYNEAIKKRREKAEQEAEQVRQEAYASRLKKEHDYWDHQATEQEIKEQEAAIKENEKKKEEARKANDEYFDKVWKKEHDVLSSVADGLDLISSPLHYAGAKLGLWDSASKNLYDLQQSAASLLLGSSGAREGSYQGLIDLEDVKKQSAEAHKIMLNRKEWQNQYDLLEESIADKKRRGLAISQDELDQYNSVRQQLLDINDKYSLKDLQQLDDMYKSDQIEERSNWKGWLARRGRDIWDNISTAGILDSQSRQARASRQAQRRAQDAAIYDQMINSFRLKDIDRLKVQDQTLDEALQQRKNLSPIEQQFLQNRNKTRLQQEDPKVSAQRSNNDIDVTNNYIQKRDNNIVNLQNKAINEKKLQDRIKKRFEYSDTFQRMVESTQGSGLLSKDYWLYQVPNMVGSSNSSPSQIAANAIQYGSMFLGPYGAALGYLTSTPLQYEGAKDENYAQVSERRTDNLKQYFQNENPEIVKSIMNDLKELSIDYYKNRGMDDAWIADHVSNQDNLIRDLADGVVKNNSTVARKGLLLSDKGLKAEFDADMIRTAGEIPVQFALNVMPVGKMMRGLAGYGRTVAKTAVNKVASKAGKAVIESTDDAAKVATKTGKYTNKLNKQGSTIDSFVKGYEQGADIADLSGMGFTGSVIYGTAAGTARATAHAGKRVAEAFGADTAWMDAMQKAWNAKYAHVLEKITPSATWAKLATQYGLRAAKKGIASSLSEGAEEGVQYLNSKKDFATIYGYDGMMLGDMIANDLEQGGRVQNAYLSLLGLSNSELWSDDEFVQNYKGGFALGGANPGFTTINNIYKSFNDLTKEISASEVIKQSAIFNREVDKIDRASNSTLAKLAMSKKGEAAMNVLDRMLKEDEYKDEPEFSQEDYESKKQDLKKIISLVNDNDVRKKLEKKGFIYGTDEYAHAIADIFNLQQSLIQGQKEFFKTNADLNRHYSQKEYQEALDALVQDELDSLLTTNRKLQSDMTKAGVQAVNQAEAQAAQNGEDINTAEFDAYRQQVRKDAEQLVINNAREQIKANILSNTRNVNKAKALLKLRAEANTAKDIFDFIQRQTGLKTKRPDAKLIEDRIDKEIKEIKQDLAKNNEGLSENMSDEELFSILDGRIKGALSTSLDEQALTLEATMTMIGADQEIVNSYYNQFESEKGKDRYSDRIKKIMEANERNQKLDWMVNDIYTGDAVTKYQKQVEKEIAEETRKAKEEAEKAKKAVPTIEDKKDAQTSKKQPKTELKQSKTTEKLTGNLAASKKKYEENKRKAIEGFKRRRNRMMKNAHAVGVVGAFGTMIAHLANGIVTAAQIGTYKIQDFIEEVRSIKEALGEGDLTQEELAKIKQTYSFKVLLISKMNPELVKNLSTVEEIQGFEGTVETKPRNEYVTPSFNQSSTDSFIQSTLSKESEHVNKELSTYYDTIVEHDGVVEIYPNVSEADLTFFNGGQLAKDLKEANTSEEAFKTKLEQLGLNTDYVKYRNVDGIYDLLERVFYNKNAETSTGIIIGKAVREYVAAKFAGNDEEINKLQPHFSLYGKSFSEFVKNLDEQIEKLKNAGITPVVVNPHIYGTDSNGNKVSSQLDILLVNKHGELYVIDVMTSMYDFNKELFGQNIRGKSYSRKDRAAKMLHQIEDILVNKYNLPVKSLSVLPVTVKKDGTIKMYDRLVVEGKQPKDTINPTAEIDTEKEQYKQTIEKVNQTIDQYNGLKSDAQKHHVPFTTYSNIPESEFDTAEEYKQAAQNAADVEMQVLDMANQVRENIFRAMDSENREWAEQQDPTLFDEIQQDAQSLMNQLVDDCTSLDVAMNEVTTLYPKTPIEKQKLDEFISALAKAQESLNQVLSNTESSLFNVQEEQEVIAAAMEKIAQSDYGDKGLMVQRWWLTQFAIGVSNNTIGRANSDSEKRTLYRDTILSWTNTLKQHVLVDIEDNPRLQKWYSTLLNNYFSVLMDNAEKIITDGDIDEALSLALTEVISEGRALVKEFNDEYGVQPDELLTGPFESEAHAIDAMPIKWVDLYGVTDKHSPAFDKMSRNPHYYEMSNMPDFAEKALFQFEISRETGDILVYIRYGNKYATLPFYTNLNNYNKGLLTEEQIRHIKRANRYNKLFTDKIKAIIEYRKRNGISTKNYVTAEELNMTVTVNKGSLRYGKNKPANHVSDFLFKGQDNQVDLYTVTTGDDNHIGIVLIMIKKKETERGEEYSTIMKVVGDSKFQMPLNGFSSDYLKPTMHIPSGALVYDYQMKDGSRIPAVINSSKFTPQDAATIANLLRMLAQGNTTYNGFDIADLLKMRLYMADDFKFKGSMNDKINMVLVVENVVYIGNTPYDINTQMNDLITRLSEMYNTIEHSLLNENMNNSNFSVFSKAKQYFFINPSANQLTLPNGMVLSRDDFEHKNTNGSSGSTFLGYLFRNGTLRTNVVGYTYKQVNFGNPTIAKKPTNESLMPTKEEQEEKKKNDLQSITANMMRELGFNLKMIVNTNEVVVRNDLELSEFKRNILEYFEKTLGGPVDIDKILDDNAFTTISDTEVSIGVCTAEFIKIAKCAPDTVMYHEAFHRILELILPEDQRESFYEMYRDKYGKGKDLSDRDIAEGLADMFTDYMESKMKIKEAKGFNKIYAWLKKVAFNAGLIWKLGYSNSVKLYSFYKNINRGKYANKKVSQKAKDRFLKVFPEGLYYTVKNSHTGRKANLEQFTNSYDVSEMANALAFLITQNFNVSEIDSDFSKVKFGENIPSILLSEKSKVADYIKLRINPESDYYSPQFAEIFTPAKRYKTDKKGNFILKDGKKIEETYYPNFNAIMDLVVDTIEQIGTEYKDKFKQAPEEYDEDEDVQRKNIDKYDRASYEFSKLDSTTLKVKLFFSTFVYLDENGRPDLTKNKFGCPVYMPLEKVYNVLVNDLHEAQSVNDLLDRIEKIQDKSMVHKKFYEKYKQIVENLYTYDESGNLVTADYDREAFAIQILSCIRSQKIDFIVARSEKTNNGKKVDVTSSSYARDERYYPNQWSTFFISGQVPILSTIRDRNGNVVVRKGKEDECRNIAEFLNQLSKAMSSNANEFQILDKVYNKLDNQSMSDLRDDVIRKLNSLGVMMSKEAFDYMLTEQYGNTGADALRKWILGGGVSSINKFLDFLNSIINKDGLVDQKLAKKGFSEIGFIKELGNWTAKHQRVTVQQMTLGLNGKKLYSISQNSSISHIVNQLNFRNTENPTIKTLSNFGYNIHEEGDKRIGSIILKAIAEGINQHIDLHTFIGFKTDRKDDGGAEYQKQSTIEDYIAKMTMLQQGKLIFPTLADKGTYVVMSGVNIPGMTIAQKEQIDKNGNKTGNMITVTQNVPQIDYFDGQWIIHPSGDQIMQMIEYAKCERLGIQQCMEDLGYDNIPGYEKQGRPKLDDDAKIKNYHTSNYDKSSKKTIEPNGTRFLSLTNIKVRENGKLVEYNLNDPNLSSIELLKLANDKFFNKSPEEQMQIMGDTLNDQIQLEVQKAIDLGLLERKDITVYGQSNPMVSKDSLDISNLTSQHLDNDKIAAIAEAIMKQPGQDRWNKEQNAHKRLAYVEVCKSLAIASMLGDATVRSIISSQEVQRCFSGHPALFKVAYDVKNGIVKDSTFDVQKRIGGMISTGDDNVTDLPGMTSTYTCAEIKDYEIGSQATVYGKLRELFRNGNVRELYAELTEDWDVAYDESITAYDLLKKAGIEISKDDDYSYVSNYLTKLEEKEGLTDLQKALIKAIRNSEKFASSYDSGINVADGASYITAKMCKDMLRMRGAFNNKVKKAFEILEGDEAYSWMLKTDAYKIIYDEVNIVATKYTAYGFRQHTLSQDPSKAPEKVSDVAVAYYNKFALFPVFPCIATGKMKDLYQKMQDEGVDMLFMNSAVKVGSQGSIGYGKENSIDNMLNTPFNKYIQEFSFLRRQLNTDPEEGENMSIGSQMVKVGLQSLRLDRKNYKDSRTGENVSGRELFKKYMGHINELAKLGDKRVKDKFFKEDGVTIDNEKLSNYLKDQLSSRNANKSLIEMIQLNDNGQLIGPLAATPDAAWIESILISSINSEVIDIEMPGSSFVQRSVFAMEAEGDEGKIQGAEYYNGKKLEMINEEGSMDAVISIDYFKHILPKGLSFKEARQWLIDNNIIGENATANTIGYRIPTQAQSSIHALRFIDVVPATQAAIILPADFTKITGSDKPYQCSNQYNIKNPFNCLKILNQFRQPAAKSLL